jgi:hypothetical protein
MITIRIIVYENSNVKYIKETLVYTGPAWLFTTKTQRMRRISLMIRRSGFSRELHAHSSEQFAAKAAPAENKKPLRSLRLCESKIRSTVGRDKALPFPAC